MSHHLHEQLPSLNSLPVVVQSPAAPATAGVIETLSPATTKLAALPETGPRPIVNQVGLTEPVRDTLQLVPAQRIVHSTKADSVRNVGNGSRAHVCLVTYMSNIQAE
jgi:hypothetical protein